MVFALSICCLIIGFSLATYAIVAPIFGRSIVAKSDAFLPLDAGHIPRARIRESLVAIGCRIMRDQKGDIAGRTGIGIRSWGEDISVEFVDGGMKITSSCVWPMQAIDWGKNRTNVQRFVSEWQRRTMPNQSLDPTPAPGMPPAGQESRHG